MHTENIFVLLKKVLSTQIKVGPYTWLLRKDFIELTTEISSFVLLEHNNFIYKWPKKISK